MSLPARRETLANVTLLTITVVFFLLVAEAFVRITGLERPISHQSPDRELVAQRVLGFTSVHRVSTDPSLGWELQPGSQGFVASYTGGVTDIHINSLGFRDVEFDSNKPAGVFRVLFLGDSMTFGLGVPLEETIPKVLEQMLNTDTFERAGVRFQVINAGVSGYNTYQQVAFLKNRGLALSPDLVIVGFAPNDVSSPPLAGLPLVDAPTEATPRTEERVESVAADELSHASMRTRIRDALWRRSSLFRFAMRRWHSIKVMVGMEDRYDATSRRYFEVHDAALGDRTTTEWQWLSLQLRSLRDVTAAQGVPAVIVFLPWEHMLWPEYEVRAQRIMAAVCEEFGLHLVDPLPSLRAKRTGRFFIDPLHFNGPGNRIVAEAIHQALIEHGLLPGGR